MAPILLIQDVRFGLFFRLASLGYTQRRKTFSSFPENGRKAVQAGFLNK